MRWLLLAAGLLHCGASGRPAAVEDRRSVDAGRAVDAGDARPAAVAQEGGACDLADDVVCTADAKAMLRCRDDRWILAQGCRGERACVMEAKKVTCDNSVASPGDACLEDDDYACTPDQKSAVACRGGKFGIAATCKGPKGCLVAGTKETGFRVACDDSLAALGDPCEKEDHFACTADGRSILRCRAKRHELEERCKARESCAIKGGQIGCY